MTDRPAGSRVGAKVRHDILTQLRVASPCKERWADMVGDDRARLCNRCDRQVFDLSELTSEQAHALFATHGVTPCVRFRRRADGTVVTADCPTQRPAPRRLAVMAGAIVAGAAMLAASTAGAYPLPLPLPSDGRIQGVIKDASTGEPAIGATVMVSGAALNGQLAAITDENGFYTVAELPPGDYTITVYYLETTRELPAVQVTIGTTTVVDAQVDRGITIDEGYLTMGIPVMDHFDEPHRPAIEWSSWVRLGYGAEAQAPKGVARLIEPQEPDRDGTWEAALGADVSVPVANRGDLRIGAWAEVRTSSGPVLGGEILVEAAPRHLDLFQYDGEGVLALRAGGNGDVVTAAIAYGYLAPWALFHPSNGRTRYTIGVRLVASATRSVDDPRDWSATAGLEFEPVGALRYVLGIRSWY